MKIHVQSSLSGNEATYNSPHFQLTWNQTQRPRSIGKLSSKPGSLGFMLVFQRIIHLITYLLGCFVSPSNSGK